MCQQHVFGDISVTQVVEQRGAGFAPDFLFPDWDPAVLEQHRALMIPHCFDEAQHRFIASIHTWVVKTRHHTILIDSCAGNDKNRRGMPRFHMRDLPFLQRLDDAGVTPASFDFVMCTHLHADHCGWNTRRVDGRWVPTFPNAKYVFSRTEYDACAALATRGGPEGVDANVFNDSVLPVIEAGQADIVDGARDVGDGLFLQPTPGHTTGHLAVLLDHGGRHGVFSGDIVHQPLQVYRPEWNSAFCANAVQARAPRRWLLDHAAEHRATVFTAHFAHSSAGQVSRRGEAFHWDFA